MAQAYRFSYDEIAKLTYPQILMLNHAADVNRRRMDVRIKANRDNGTSSMGDTVGELPLIGGKRLDELTSNEYLNYLGQEGPRPKVIKVKPPQE